MPRQGSAPAARQKPKPLAEVSRQLPYAEYVDARCSQFESQRHTVEPAANLQNCWHAGVVEREALRSCRGALVEQLNGRIRQRLGSRQVDRVRRKRQEGKRCNHSPSARNGSLLVTRMRTCGAAFRTASTSGATAPMTCSQLSSTSNICLSRSQAASPDTGLAPDREIPSTVPRALGTSSGSDSEASPTNDAPSGQDALTVSATAIATVVLPIPPGPTMVSNRR